MNKLIIALLFLLTPCIAFAGPPSAPPTVGAGSGDMLAANNLSEVTDATAATNIGLGTGDSPQFTGVNVGHATDTTITRVGAGLIEVEGEGVITNTAAITDDAVVCGDGGVSGVKDCTSITIGDIDAGAGVLEIPNGTADAALTAGGQVNLNTTDEQISFHSAADGEISGEAALSLIQHLAVGFDPAYMYDQESTYRAVPLAYLGDNYPEGITITEWKVTYVGGDPTTELDADLRCDTTPDFNTAAGSTVMDVLDTTAGASTADTGFDSASCANGSNMHITFGADPTDANVFVVVDVWYYAEED